MSGSVRGQEIQLCCFSHTVGALVFLDIWSFWHVAFSSIEKNGKGREDPASRSCSMSYLFIKPQVPIPPVCVTEGCIVLICAVVQNLDWSGCTPLSGVLVIVKMAWGNSYRWLHAGYVQVVLWMGIHNCNGGPKHTFNVLFIFEIKIKTFPHCRQLLLQ